MQRYDKFADVTEGDIGSKGVPAGHEAVPRGDPGRKRRALRWLGVLFVVTLLLLIFQVILGWLTDTLTLVADAAHGVADVVSYALNFFVEYLKKRRRSKDEAQATIKMVDTWGSLISLVSLVFATTFAVAEALERLSDEAGRDTEKIGPALFFFSIVSTSCNIGLMLMYYHWHEKSLKRQTSPPPSDTLEDGKVAVPPPPVTIGDSKLVPPLASKEDVQVGPPPLHVENAVQKSINSQENSNTGSPQALNAEIAVPTSRPPRKRGNDRKNGLNLCGDFAGGPAAAEGQGSCQKICCRAPGEELADASECPAGAEGVGGGMLSALHRAVHPGCTCEHDESDALTGSVTTPVVTSEGRNLNLVAAMLHLITDVLRGILILGVALLIMLGGVHDAGRADAVCALIVAILIAAGSVALLLRVAGRVQAFCCPEVKEQSRSSTAQAGNQKL